MKTLQKLWIIPALAFALPLSAQPVEYTIDPMHTFVLWHINHFDFSNPSGKWYAEGTLSYDKDKIENSKVNIKINVADMVTGIKKLDEHLKGKEFFDVAQFPTATFVSDKVEAIDSKTAKVSGKLTVRGVSKPVILEVKLNKQGMSPVSNKETIGFSAHTEVKRSDFDMKAFLPGLGDNVKLDIEVEATKNK